MKEISVNQLSINPFTMIGDDWMLVTAGSKENGYNTMTASWGHLGCIWNKPTSVCYVRPQRYTKEFMDREALYTLSFFSGYKKELGYLGMRSGRDEDKVAKVCITPVYGDGFTYFAEAKLVLVCRKLYRAPLQTEGFIDRSILDRQYPARDLHDMYVGEIIRAFISE